MAEPSYIPDFITTSPWIALISTLCGKTIYTLTDFLTYMSENFLRKAAESATQSTATKNSLKVGSTEIKNIQNSGFNRPSIAFAGSEDSPALLRFVGSRKNIDAVSLIRNVYNVCSSKAQLHNIMKIAAAASLNFPAAAAHSNLSSAWKTSADYWNSGGGFYHSTDVFIGAYRVEYKTVTYWDEVCPTVPNLKTAITPFTCSNPVLVQRTRQVPIIVTEPNDGIVPFLSQKQLPGCLKVVELKGINHEEMKTHADVRIQLEKVFKGETQTTRDPSFFILSKR